MKSVELKEFAVSGGGSVDPSKYRTENFDLYSIPAYDSYRPEILPGAEIGSIKKIVQPNDVLISRIVPHIRRVWVVGPNTGRRQIASGEWIIFRGDSFDPNYLRHFLMSDPFHRQFMQTVSGVGGSLLRARPSEVEKIKVSLPPLPEQERIAAILDKADAVRKKRQQAIQLTDDFLRATFLDMFGDPVTNSKGWDTDLFEEIIIDGPQNGLYRPAEDYGKGTPILRIDSFYDGNINNLSGLKRIQIDKKIISTYQLRLNDIVINRVNSRKFLGKSALVTNLLEPTVYESNMMRLSLDEKVITPRYLVDLLQTDYVRRQILSKSRDAVNQSSINQDDVRSIEIRLPPLQLQRQYSQLVEKARFNAKKHMKWFNDSEYFFSSLAQRAFRGEL
jgi:type I restriction enzyme, S subunit